MAQIKDDGNNGNWGGNGWTQYQKLVLAELERLNDEMKDLNRSISVLQIDIATLKVKSSLWGSLGGFIAVAISIVVGHFSK